MPLDQIDLARVALALLALTELSEGQYVLIRAGRRAPDQTRQWRINVRAQGHEHTSTALDRGDPAQALLLAMDRALQWLRGVQARRHT